MEIILARAGVQADGWRRGRGGEGWGSQTIRLTVSKCSQFPLRLVCLGMRWLGTVDYWLCAQLFALDNMVVRVANKYFVAFEIFIPSKNT